MSNSNDSLNDLAQVRDQLESVTKRADDLERRLRCQIEEDAANNPPDVEVANRLREAAQAAAISNIAFQQLEARSAEQLAIRDAAIAEKDALILEWMHSNEAFKRLATQYGNKLGVTDEQRTEAYQKNILDAADEDPKFDVPEDWSIEPDAPTAKAILEGDSASTKAEPDL